MAPSFSVISWWEGGGRSNHRLSSGKNLASFCRALFCSPQAKLKGTRLATRSVGLSPMGQNVYTTTYECTKVCASLVCEHEGIKLAHLCARWTSRDLPQCEYVCVGAYVGAVGFMCVCVGGVVPVKAGWQCLQLCAQALPQLVFP